jgi:Protein of unknown function (DUF2919)
MNHTHIHSAPLYADSAYDKYFCLKPPPLLWLAVLFLSREITLPLGMGMAQVAGVNSEALTAMRRLWRFDLSIAASVVAAVVLYLFFRRVPGASRAVRWLWAHGAALLALSAIMDAATTLVAVLRVGELDDRTVLSWLTIAVDIGILCYVLMTRRVRDSFADFPPAEAAGT